MLKSWCFKFQVQVSSKKESVILSCSTDRELGSIDQELQAQLFLQIFKQARARENV